MLVLVAAVLAACVVFFIAPTTPATQVAEARTIALLDRPTGLNPGETSLTYCENGGSTQSLAVYEPSHAPTHQVPVVVFVHGGGWTGGSSALTQWSFVSQIETVVTDRGWVFVSIDYRLAPRYPWPAQIEDAKCAIRFIRANAAALHIDPNEIAAVGDSAGGQIASLLGLTANTTSFNVGQNLDVSSSVRTVIDLFGPTDLLSPDWSSSKLVQSVAPKVFGAELGPDQPNAAIKQELVDASPVTYVGRNDPPFLIMQGADDPVVPSDQSSDLAYLLKAAGDKVTLVMVQDATHEFDPESHETPSASISALVLEAAAFLVQNLTPAT